jgi:hypothetical protein
MDAHMPCEAERRRAMAREIGKLATVQLSRLPTGWHGDGGGLYLQVTKGGARTWVFRFMRAGRARWMGLGALHTISLAEARIKARECRRLLLDGLDPIEARKAKRAGERLAAATTLTFRECDEPRVSWTLARPWLGKWRRSVRRFWRRWDEAVAAPDFCGRRRVHFSSAVNTPFQLAGGASI